MGAFSSLISIEKDDPISNSLTMSNTTGRFFYKILGALPELRKSDPKGGAAFEQNFEIHTRTYDGKNDNNVNV
jgi:hypothetical protein